MSSSLIKASIAPDNVPTHTMAGQHEDASTEESNEAGNSEATTHLNDNGMSRYYYGNMDGVMEDVDEYISNVEVAETETPIPTKPFDFFDWFGLSRELRDMIFAQPGMTEDKVIGEDDFNLELGTGNKVRVAITKPRASLSLVSKKFRTEYLGACRDREELFIRTSHYVHNEGDTKMWSDEDIKQVRFLKFHMGDWSFEGSQAYHVYHSTHMTLADLNTLQHHSRHTALAELNTLQRWLTDLCAQMPCLRAVSFKLYVDGLQNISKDSFEAWLRSMASLEKFKQLKVVEFAVGPGEGADWCWDLRAKHKLLLHWRAGDVGNPTIIDPAPEYVESCCDGLEYGERDWDDNLEFD
jgi:hypothetical protein